MTELHSERRSIGIAMCDSAQLFLFFLIGAGASSVWCRFLPLVSQSVGQQMKASFLLMPAAVALLFGSTVFGIYLIPSAAFALGAGVSLMTYYLLLAAADRHLLMLFLLSAAIAVPAFFLIGVLGMRSASGLLQAMHLTGRREERESAKVFLLRLMLFSLLVLCFYLLHGTLYIDIF